MTVAVSPMLVAVSPMLLAVSPMLVAVSPTSVAALPGVMMVAVTKGSKASLIKTGSGHSSGLLITISSALYFLIALLLFSFTCQDRRQC